MRLVLKFIVAQTQTFKFAGEDTIKFIEFIVKWWLIVNNKEKLDKRLRDDRRAAIADANDWQLLFLENDMIKFLTFLQPHHFKNRSQKLTLDTSKALIRTCKGLCEMARYLLSIGFSYVLLGTFQSDIIERQFGKYRQSCGGTYLITAQNILQKFRLDSTRKYLRALTPNEGKDLLEISSDHSCKCCEEDY